MLATGFLCQLCFKGGQLGETSQRKLDLEEFHPILQALLQSQSPKT